MSNCSCRCGVKVKVKGSIPSASSAGKVGTE